MDLVWQCGYIRVQAYCNLQNVQNKTCEVNKKLLAPQTYQPTSLTDDTSSL